MRALRLCVLACGLLIIPRAQTPKAGAQIAGHLQDRAISESSGVAASRRNAGIFWTHNDSENAPEIYAFDRTGKSYGRWTVPGTRNIDWEDIDIGPGPQGSWYLYIGDIGDNSRNRREIRVYRVDEPKVGTPAECRAGCSTARPTVFRFQYPDGPHNAETLLVHPVTGDLYVVTKAWGSDRATGVYVARAPHPTQGIVTLEQIASLSIPERLARGLLGGLTGGGISPDGSRVAFCDYMYVYEARVPAGAAFDEIWKEKFTVRSLGMHLQTEGIAYTADGKRLVLTSEGNRSPVIEIPVE